MNGISGRWSFATVQHKSSQHKPFTVNFATSRYQYDGTERVKYCLINNLNTYTEIEQVMYEVEKIYLELSKLSTLLFTVNKCIVKKSG